MTYPTTEQILSRLNLLQEFQRLGVKLVSKEPNADGWITCHAVGRDDRHPSASVNVKTGRYRDHGGFGDSLSFFDLLVKLGKFPDWKSARDHYAKEDGVVSNGNDNSQGKNIVCCARSPDADLYLLEWSDELVGKWCAEFKPGVTVESLLAAGAIMARYRNKFTVIALPVWPYSFANDPMPIGWILWNADGGDLPVYHKGREPIWKKMKTTAGSKAGWIVVGDVRSISDVEEVWKTEGPADALALWSVMPEEHRARAAIVSNSGGCYERPPVDSFGWLSGKQVAVIHDCDEPGQCGAMGDTNKGKIGWASAMAPSAAMCRNIVLPYPIEPNHGRDLRDWLNDGHTFAELRMLEEAMSIVAAHYDHPLFNGHDKNIDDELPQVILPGGGVTVSRAATHLGTLLGQTKGFFNRSGCIVRLDFDDRGKPILRPVSAAQLVSDFETVAALVKVKATRDGEKRIPTICTEAMARSISHSASFLRALPRIKLVAPCAVLVETDGKLRVVQGYDPSTGILAHGPRVEEVSLDEAIETLKRLSIDFDFASPGDGSRAVAGVITPALVMGGLLEGRAPIDLCEADNSQAGKGYRNKITAAVYNSVPCVVNQSNGGVGSLKESFDAALVAGRQFIAFDNVRGNVDMPALESFCTEDSYFARIPYHPPIEIDPTRTLLMFTSNRAEMIVDLANRTSVTRILKRDDSHSYQRFAEGDLLDHVRANQPRILAAVFRIIKEWHGAGKQRTEKAKHDFREWAQILDWIVVKLLGHAPLMSGHREVQRRTANPALTWLRDVASIVKQLGRRGEWLRAHDLLDLIVDAGSMPIPSLCEDEDIENKDARDKALRSIGLKMNKAFDKATFVEVDGVKVERRGGKDDEGRDRKEYAFSS